MADYVLCAAHSSNLTLSNAVKHIIVVSQIFDNLDNIILLAVILKRCAMISNDSFENIKLY